jgi:hypothetical protein
MQYISSQGDGSGGYGATRYVLQKKSRSVVCRDIYTLLTMSQFHFDDIGEDGQAPVQVIPLSADEIRDEAQQTVDSAPSDVDYEYGMACSGPPYHTDGCEVDQEHGLLCIQDRLFEAYTRLHGYRSRHWLKECLQKPERAQARRFLEQGLLQKSFVYQHEEVSIIPQTIRSIFLIEIQAVGLPVDAKGLANSGEMRGIFVTLGWNVSRMLFHLRVGSVYTLVGLAIVWIFSVLWAGHRGDWSTAMAFGQLLAASLTLILHHA